MTIRNKYYSLVTTLLLHEDLSSEQNVAIHETNTSHLQFFYIHKLQKSSDIDVKQIRSSDNLANYDIQEDCS